MLWKDLEMLWKDVLPQDMRPHLDDVRLLLLMMHFTGSNLEKREVGGLAPPRPSTEEGIGVKTDETGVLGHLQLLRMQHHAAGTALKTGMMATGETCRRNETSGRIAKGVTCVLAPLVLVGQMWGTKMNMVLRGRHLTMLLARHRLGRLMGQT